MAHVEPEELDDLLGGSDEEDDKEAPKMLDIASLDICTGTNNAALIKTNPILLDIDMLDFNDDDESDEEDEGESNAADDDETAVAKREKLVKILSRSPPGIDLFPTKNEEDNGFHYFNLESLSLEKDCGYSRRGHLLGHGMTIERIEDVLTNRYQLIQNLFPEAHSVLICDKEDFKAIMNFLFYSISVCSDPRLSDLMAKALFDLRRNYSFRWDLDLQHVFTVLINYGVETNAVYNEKFYNRANVGLTKHLELVIKSGQKSDKKYQPPKLQQFLKKRKDSAKQKPLFQKVSSPHFEFCLQRLLTVICQWSAGCSSHLGLRYKNNFSDQLVFLYVLLLLGTDRRLVGNSSVKDNIREAVHAHLDSFSHQQWHWGPVSKETGEDQDTEFNHHHVHKCLVRLLNEFFPGELCPSVMTWNCRERGQKESRELVTNYDESSDHHLNMIYRISLVPDSYRGNQLRKYLAFLYLETLAGLKNSRLPAFVDVTEVTQTVELCEKLAVGIKFIVRSDNFMMTMTLLELYDIIIGFEHDVDFVKDKLSHIDLLREKVLGWIQRKMPGVGQYLDINSERSIKAMMLREFVDILENRWKSG